MFLDEIGELHPIQMNKLLKVLEDRKVMLESAYYNADDTGVPRYIHDIFKNGLPADFRLVGATTRSPQDISPALRSRCMEVFFRALEPEEIADPAATDGAYLSTYDVPTVDALSAIAEQIHTTEERVRIPSIRDRTALCAAMLGLLG